MVTKVRKNLEIKKLIATFAETKAKRNSMNENEKQERLQIELPQNVAQGEYANFAIITHGSSDFVVDFARVLPGVSKAQVCSRIILAGIKLPFSGWWKTAILEQ